MKFKIDENLPVEITSILKSSGHEAMTVHEQELSGAKDPKVIDVCSHENCVLVTLDLDFADIKTYPPENYPGIMVMRVHRQDKFHLLKIFRWAVPRISEETLSKQLWIIEETRIRIHGEKY